jgi:hypothetical protein
LLYDGAMLCGRARALRCALLVVIGLGAPVACTLTRSLDDLTSGEEAVARYELPTLDNAILDGGQCDLGITLEVGQAGCVLARVKDGLPGTTVYTCCHVKDTSPVLGPPDAAPILSDTMDTVGLGMRGDTQPTPEGTLASIASRGGAFVIYDMAPQTITLVGDAGPGQVTEAPLGNVGYIVEWNTYFGFAPAEPRDVRCNLVINDVEVLGQIGARRTLSGDSFEDVSVWPICHFSE